MKEKEKQLNALVLEYIQHSNSLEYDEQEKKEMKENTRTKIDEIFIKYFANFDDVDVKLEIINLHDLLEKYDPNINQSSFLDYFNYINKNRDKNRMLEEKINSIGHELCLAKQNGDAQQVKRLTSDLILYSMQRFDKQYGNAMFVIDAINEGIEKFDESKGKLSNYISYLIPKRKKDAFRHDNIYQKNNKKYIVNTISIDQEHSDDDKRTLHNKDLSNNTQNDVKNIEFFLSLTALILKFISSKNYECENNTRHRWYRIFYTEDITCLIKELGVKTFDDKNRDVFSTIYSNYLNYYMVDNCNSINEIYKTDLKTYEEVIPSKKGNKNKIDIKLFDFPREVSVNYLKTYEKITKGLGDSSISGYHKDYKNYILIGIS